MTEELGHVPGQENFNESIKNIALQIVPSL